MTDEEASEWTERTGRLVTARRAPPRGCGFDRPVGGPHYLEVLRNLLEEELR